MDDSNKEIHMRYQIETERSDLFDMNIVITMRVGLDKDVPFDELKSAFDKIIIGENYINKQKISN